MKSVPMAVCGVETQSEHRIAPRGGIDAIRLQQKVLVEVLSRAPPQGRKLF